ncbi:zinc-dependent metalloprotease [Saprospira grandis]|nr:zinc-dependent metalloprotease [Saprospira grandis]
MQTSLFRLLFLFCLLGGSAFSGLQAQQTGHNHIGCGTTVETQLERKNSLMEHRRNRAELMQEFTAFKASRAANDSISYVPLQFHVCGENDGSGYVDVERVLGSVCRLNDDYRGQNIQFYIYNINYIPNSLLYNHGNGSGNPTAIYFMSLYKVPGVLNIFVGRNVTANDQFLAYYTSFLDVVFSFKTGVGPGDPTLTHELGHFFTLPHTFFGWEGTNYANEELNGKAPGQVGGMQVEKVVRGAAGENCQIAADGFCDTRPDYSSDRANCPQTAIFYDPDSVMIDPDETNFMSYFNDNCLSQFSDEQKDAILLDFVSRGYHLFDTPSPLYSSAAPSIDWPNAGALVGSPNQVELRWTGDASNSYYLVKLERIVGGAAIPVASYITSDEFYWVSLQPNSQYRWSVQGMTAYDVCSNFVSAPADFSTANWATGIETTALPLQSSRVFPNPIGNNDELNIEIEVSQLTEVNIKLTNQLGQQMLPSQSIQIAPGKQVETLYTNDLAPGVYFVQIETAQERISHKVVVQP